MRIYLKHNYQEVTLGSANRVEVVKADRSSPPIIRYFVEGNQKEYKVLEKLGFLEGQGETLEYEKETPEEVGEQEPDEFFCRDHEESHQKGDAMYYACIDKFQNGTWDIDSDLKDQEQSLDTRTHTMNNHQVLYLAKEIANVDELKSIYEGECEHPDYKGGRTGAKRIIEERIAELQQTVSVE
jgi:hypothetical protein